MRILILLVALSVPALAQYPAAANALFWQGTTSTAGPFCWGFSCIPEIATVTPGETGTLTVRGEYLEGYILAAAPTATRCLAIPGFAENSLVLDDPITIWTSGTLLDQSPILACPNGTATLTLTVPPSVPSGLEVSVQAITTVSSVPITAPWAFTQTITFRVL